jgi:hypothetical protein
VEIEAYHTDWMGGPDEEEDFEGPWLEKITAYSNRKKKGLEALAQATPLLHTVAKVIRNSMTRHCKLGSRLPNQGEKPGR